MTEKWADAIGSTSKLFHIFEDGRSLCGKYGLSSFAQTAEVEDSDTWRSGKDCKACCRKSDIVDVEEK